MELLVIFFLFFFSGMYFIFLKKPVNMHCLCGVFFLSKIKNKQTKNKEHCGRSVKNELEESKTGGIKTDFSGVGQR